MPVVNAGTHFAQNLEIQESCQPGAMPLQARSRSEPPTVISYRNYFCLSDFFTEHLRGAEWLCPPSSQPNRPGQLRLIYRTPQGSRMTSPCQLLGRLRELLGSPRELVGSSRELVGSPRELVGSPRELLGRPGELLEGDQVFIYQKYN